MTMETECLTRARTCSSSSLQFDEGGDGGGGGSGYAQGRAFVWRSRRGGGETGWSDHSRRERRSPRAGQGQGGWRTHW